MTTINLRCKDVSIDALAAGTRRAQTSIVVLQDVSTTDLTVMQEVSGLANLVFLPRPNASHQTRPSPFSTAIMSPGPLWQAEPAQPGSTQAVFRTRLPVGDVWVIGC